MAGAEAPTFSIDPRSTKFAPDTTRGQGERVELADMLEALAWRSGIAPDDVTVAGEPTDSEQLMKGDPVTIGAIVLALVNAGAVTAVIGCVRDWLGRNPTERELHIEGQVGEQAVDVTVTASNIDSADVAAALETALQAGAGS